MSLIISFDKIVQEVVDLSQTFMEHDFLDCQNVHSKEPHVNVSFNKTRIDVMSAETVCRSDPNDMIDLSETFIFRDDLMYDAKVITELNELQEDSCLIDFNLSSNVLTNNSDLSSNESFSNVDLFLNESLINVMSPGDPLSDVKLPNKTSLNDVNILVNSQPYTHLKRVSQIVMERRILSPYFYLAVVLMNESRCTATPSGVTFRYSVWAGINSLIPVVMPVNISNVLKLFYSLCDFSPTTCMTIASEGHI